MTTEPRRLHPAAILLHGLGALKDAALPLILAFIAGMGAGGPGGSARTLAIAGVVIAVVVGYRRWSTTRWWVSPGGVHLRSGLFSTSETVVPRNRIQAIDTSQNPLQRLLGTLSVQVQTAGGGSSAEIVLAAVTPADARALRAAVDLPEPAEHDVERLSLGLGALLVAALTAPQLGVLLPLIAGAATVGDEVVSEGLRRGWFERLPAGPAVIMVALAVGLLAWALSMLATIVSFANFTVERDGDRLRIRRGLGQRRVASLPLSRIHAVSVVEGLVRQPFGLASLRLETAGYRNEPAAAQTLFPMLRRRDAEAVISRFVPDLAGTMGPLSRPPRRALRRYIGPEAAVGLLAAGILIWRLPAAWPIALLVALAGVIHGAARFRAAGWRLAGGRVVIRDRRLARRTLAARTTRLQEHGISQSLLQRRAGLADFTIAVGSGRRAGIAHIERDVAGELLSALEPRRVAQDSSRDAVAGIRPSERDAPMELA